MVWTKKKFQDLYDSTNVFLDKFEKLPETLRTTVPSCCGSENVYKTFSSTKCLNSY